MFRNEADVRAAIARGLSVRQGNIEEGLADYRDDAFDYAVLSQTIAYLNRPALVLRELLRVGKRAVVSFDNAGYWRARLAMAGGRGFGSTLASGDPVVRAITLEQFEAFVHEAGARIERRDFTAGHRRVTAWPALAAQSAIYTLARA